MVTTAGTLPPPPPRPPPNALVEPLTHPFWSALGSENFDAIPLRLPVTEWHAPHTALKVASPFFGLPTSTFSVTLVGLRPGGLPCPPIVACTLWMYSAIAIMSASLSVSGGVCLATLAPISSPF